VYSLRRSWISGSAQQDFQRPNISTPQLNRDQQNMAVDAASKLAIALEEIPI
jgi:hypothetical protein